MAVPSIPKTPPTKPRDTSWVPVAVLVGAFTVLGSVALWVYPYVEANYSAKKRGLAEAEIDIPQIQSWLLESAQAAKRYPTDKAYRDHFPPDSYPYHGTISGNEALGPDYLYTPAADFCTYTLTLLESPFGEGTTPVKTWTSTVNACQ